MRNSQVPREFTIGAPSNHEYLKHLSVLVLPLEPRHMFDKDLFPIDPKAKKELERQQTKWGTGTASVPLIMFTPRGTQEFTVRWAMVRPEELTKTPEELLKHLKRAQEDVGFASGAELYVKSLQFAYAAVTGERAPGDDLPEPLKTLPSGK